MNKDLILKELLATLTRVKRTPAEQIPLVQDLIQSLCNVLVLNPERHKFLVQHLLDEFMELEILRDMLRSDICIALGMEP